MIDLNAPRSISDRARALRREIGSRRLIVTNERRPGVEFSNKIGAFASELDPLEQFRADDTPARKPADAEGMIESAAAKYAADAATEFDRIEIELSKQFEALATIRREIAALSGRAPASAEDDPATAAAEAAQDGA